jgi:hypothetical protein
MKKEFLMSFENACAWKGISTDLPDVSSFPEHLRKHVIATYKLSVILEVNNDDWKLNLSDTSQYKYYPWFKINQEEGPSGFALSYGDYGCTTSYSCLGARLACRSSELAEFMGRNCIEIYKDLLS